VELGIVVGVRVNEPGRDNLPRGVKPLSRITVVEPPNRGNLAMLDANVSLVAWNSRTVYHRVALLIVSNSAITPTLVKLFLGKAYS